MKRETIEKCAAVLAVVLLYLLMFSLGITCPIRFVTGISCAGCGMTRAWISLLQLDPAQAFYYHPLFWTLPAVVLLFVFRKRLSRRFFSACASVIIALFLVVYLIRLFWGDGVVVAFSPLEGIVARVVRGIIEGG